MPFKKRPEGAQPAPGPLAELRGLRVLIVDDNATNRRVLCKQISPWGVRGESAEDGLAALRMLHTAADRGEPFDLAILDMQMPGMDGLELARKIKADPAIWQTKLVLLTSVGQGGGEDGEEARRAGIEAYLTKPARQHELRDALATVVGRRSAGEAAQPGDAPLVTRNVLREARAQARARVLVAEDNAVNQKVAVRMLERLSYKADVAANGREAVEALFSGVPYSAVLMDVQMPEMDGYEATAEIRRREESEGKRTPIIAMTANAMQGDREEALAAGMDDYVSKPVKPEELGAVLERWIPRPAEETLAPAEGATDDGSAVAAPGGAADPLDRGVLAGLRELGDQELLKELAELFLGDAPARLEALRGAIEGGDAASVERVAHALKGSCGNMGATGMAATCAELEEAGRSGGLARAPMLMERLEAELGRVRAALEKELTSS